MIEGVPTSLWSLTLSASSPMPRRPLQVNTGPASTACPRRADTRQWTCPRVSRRTRLRQWAPWPPSVWTWSSRPRWFTALKPAGERQRQEGWFEIEIGCNSENVGVVSAFECLRWSDSTFFWFDFQLFRLDSRIQENSAAGTNSEPFLMGDYFEIQLPGNTNCWPLTQQQTQLQFCKITKNGMELNCDHA